MAVDEKKTEKPQGRGEKGCEMSRGWGFAWKVGEHVWGGQMRTIVMYGLASHAVPLWSIFIRIYFSIIIL
jgi:hypothetical protein